MYRALFFFTMSTEIAKIISRQLKIKNAIRQEISRKGGKYHDVGEVKYST